MMLLQVPAPPDIPVIVGTGPDPYAILAMVALVMGGILVFPLVRALARRLEGHSGAGSRAELETVHERLAELEAMEQRVLELENRIEFSERLLARQADDAPAKGGS